MTNLAPSEPERLIQRILATLPEIQAIYLFGSYAAQRANAQSDLDLALLLPPRQAFLLAHDVWWKLTDELSELAGCPVDLINMRQVSTVFQIEILRTGQRIFCANLPQCNEYEGLALSLYQKLNEERAEILEAIRTTGVIYG
ncbi:MAG: nucleotidyltransferase domain-containing protein [Caldilineaceae bacterium]|nr:nucleotidyltransferase domain-containing protein [Caldilineaceae bacterium]